MFNDNKKNGFTLIEIMVASSIFIIVMVIAVGAILALVNGNRKAQALSSVVSNLNISLESMIRDIRTGTDYSITGSAGKNVITFTNSDSNTTVYSLVDGVGCTSCVIHKSITGSVNFDGDITAPEVTISALSMVSRGIPSGDGLQPEVLFLVKGTAGDARYASPFNIQTLISQRVLDS